MADETKADPAALRAYSADMRARVATTRHALGDYQMAIAAFNAAPKEEVEHTIVDRSGQIAADLDWLALVDAQPEAFAEALETVDRTAFPAGRSATAGIRRRCNASSCAARSTPRRRRWPTGWWI